MRSYVAIRKGTQRIDDLVSNNGGWFRCYFTPYHFPNVLIHAKLIKKLPADESNSLVVQHAMERERVCVERAKTDQ